MRNLNIIITGAGAPGITGTLYSLKNNYDNRKIRTIGTDIQSNVIGKYILDGFYQINRPEIENEFINDLLRICKLENIDFILPQVTEELQTLSKNLSVFENIGVRVAVNNSNSLNIANNKYLIIKEGSKCNIPVPKIRLVTSLKEFNIALEQLDYPEKPIVCKPTIGSGMRGFRILMEDIDKYNAWINEKPYNAYISKNEMIDLLNNHNFPELILMEYLPGDEYSVDALTLNGRSYATIPRLRAQIRNGITFHGIVEKNENIIEYSNRLIDRLKLNYAIGFQFKKDKQGIPKLIECNPRIQGTMILSTLAKCNIIYSVIKILSEEELPKFDINWHTQFLRYWGGISITENEIDKII